MNNDCCNLTVYSSYSFILRGTFFFVMYITIYISINYIINTESVTPLFLIVRTVICKILDSSSSLLYQAFQRPQ